MYRQEGKGQYGEREMGKIGSTFNEKPAPVIARCKLDDLSVLAPARMEANSGGAVRAASRKDRKAAKKSGIRG